LARYGDILLIDEDFESAKHRFETSVRLARQAQHNWITAYSLNGLGKAELGLNDIKSAKGHFNEAMRLARKTRDTGINLLVLNSVARLLAQTGKIERAVELGGLVLNHFASWNEIKGQASLWISSLKQNMESKTFNELQKRGQSLDLWETVDQVIIDLEE
jgi:predicted negative regulator of RcsB-dependent stress response